MSTGAGTRRNSQPRRATAEQRREAVISGVLAGRKVVEIAAEMHVRPETVSRLLHEPDTAFRLAQRREAIARASRDALVALHAEALAVVLEDVRTRRDPQTALGALRVTMPAVAGTRTLIGPDFGDVIEQLSPEERRVRLEQLVREGERRLRVVSGGASTPR